MSNRVIHYSIAFLMQFFISVAMLSVPLLATQLGASNVELGLIGSLGAAAYAFTVVAAGTLSDRLGRKRVIVGGTIFTGLIYAIMPMSRAPVHLLILMPVSGCAMAFFWPVLEAWMSEEGDAEQVRRGLGGFNVSWSAGICLGPLVGGILYTKSSTLALLSAAVGTCVVAYLASFHKESAAVRVELPRDTIPPAESGPARVDRLLLYAAWAANFACWFALSEIRVLFPKLGLTLGMQPWVIGNLMFILGLVLTGMFYLMGASGRWHNTTVPLLFAQALIFLFLIMTAASDSVMMFGIAFGGLSVGVGVTYSYSLYYSVLGSPEKGAASGRHEMVLGLGALLGPLAGGTAAELCGTQRAPYLLGAALVLVSFSVGIALWVSARKRTRIQIE